VLPPFQELVPSRLASGRVLVQPLSVFFVVWFCWCGGARPRPRGLSAASLDIDLYGWRNSSRWWRHP